MQVDGGRIAYQVHGDGPPVLFIQGVGVPGSGWQPQVDGLGHRFRCLTFDNRGLGGSTAPIDRLSIEQMADDALALLDHQGWETAHVVGHSMGGLIAQQLALDAPRRVASLALLCTFARGTQAARIDAEIAWFGLRMTLGTRAMRRRAAIRLVLPDPYLATRDFDALAAELGTLFGRDLADTPAISRRQIRAMHGHDPSPRIPEIRHLPTLVVAADSDRIVRPAFSEELAASFGVEPIVLSGAGHACTVQLASDVNTLLAAHFDGYAA